MNTRLHALPDRLASKQRQVLPVGQVDGTTMSDAALRIGAVGYLNSKPLVEGLVELLPETRIRLDFPSRLADDLTAGQLDVALIPSIEFFRGHKYQIISDACVSAHGPVLSVKLYSRVPWGDVKSLALDEGSRTSATLARILLSERFGVQPDLEPLPFDQRTEDTHADAILLIGDRAILPPREKFVGTWDLGQEWFEWTGLPFVFAMWVANDRKNASSFRKAEVELASPGLKLNSSPGTFERNEESADFDFVEKALRLSRDLGIARLDEIARREAPLMGLSMPMTFSYLSENLQYHLGSAERTGLKLFYELAAGMGLAPEGRQLAFRISGGKGN